MKPESIPDPLAVTLPPPGPERTLRQARVVPAVLRGFTSPQHGQMGPRGKGGSQRERRLSDPETWTGGKRTKENTQRRVNAILQDKRKMVQGQSREPQRMDLTP